MKKVTKFAFALIVMFAVIVMPFSVRNRIARAEDNKSGDSSGDINNQDQSGGQGGQDQQDSEEHDISSMLNTDQAQAPQLNLPSIDEKSIVTYADVVTIVKSYETAIAQLNTSAGVDSGSTSLTPAEKTLLDGLLSKHKSHFNHLDSRISETSAQLKALEDLLTPLGTQTISTSFGIRDLLISELKNYRDILNGISEFDGLATNILEQETD